MLTLTIWADPDLQALRAERYKETCLHLPSRVGVVSCKDGDHEAHGTGIPNVDFDMYAATGERVERRRYVSPPVATVPYLTW